MTRAYDEAGQLKQQKDIVVATGKIISQFDFKYDAAGDIIQESITPEPTIEVVPFEMTYQAANRLATYNSEVVQFDADGNMTKGPLAGELTDFAFDSRNRLIQADSTVYRYDVENQRIGVNQTQFVVNSQPALSQVLVRTKGNGEVTYYVYGLGLIGEASAGNYFSYHYDLRGSTVALSDASGQVIERFQYSPYGMLLSAEAEKTPFLFNGMYGVMTDSNGLYYMRARFYSPEMRRFVNQDILLGFVEEGQTLNRYAFVTGRPVSYIDPFGLASWRPQTEEGCRKLKRRIENLKKELERQRTNLKDNPQGLPTFPSCPDAKKAESALGHIDLYFQYKRDLKNALDDYNKRCGGPGGTPTPIPTQPPVPNPNSSNQVYFWTVGTTTIIIVGVGIFLAPELTIPGLLMGGIVLKTAQ